MLLDLRQLEHVAALAEHGSFTRAAAALGSSQPAFSRSIQAAERAVGARLFDRTRKGAMPTALGKLVVERARRVLREAAELSREVAVALALEIGQVRVGVGPYPAEISVGKAAGRLARRWPGIRTELVVGHWETLTEAVAQGELDLAVIEISVAEADPRLCVEPLPQHPGFFFCRRGHALTGRGRLTLDEIRGFPCASPMLPERFPLAVSSIRADTFQLAKRVVLESDAVGLAVHTMIEAELRDGLLAALDVDAPWLLTRYGFVSLANRTASPAALAFMEEVRAIESEIAAAG
jgi:DNA-binding transcriptional LysR family regulator